MGTNLSPYSPSEKRTRSYKNVGLEPLFDPNSLLLYLSMTRSRTKFIAWSIKTTSRPCPNFWYTTHNLCSKKSHQKYLKEKEKRNKNNNNNNNK